MKKMHKNANIFPTLPGESAKIREYRAQCQKPRQKEEIWTWYVLRRFSIYITLGLRRTGVTPNAISWAGVLFFLLTGGLMVIAEPWAYIVAVLMYNAGYMCDCVDGELARLKQVTSRRGVFIDTLIRAASIPITVSFALAVLAELSGAGASSFGPFLPHLQEGPLGAGALLSEEPLPLAVSLLLYGIAIAATFALLVPMSYHLAYVDAEERDPVSDMRTTSTRMEWIAFFFGLPGFFAILAICAALDGMIDLSLVPLWIVMFLGLFCAKTLARLYMTYKQIR